MMSFTQKKLSLALLLCFTTVSIFPRSNSAILPRSQSVNAARELVGWQQFINKADCDSLYSAFSLTAEYEQSFRGARLMQFLFDGDITLASTSAAQRNIVSFCSQGCDQSAQLSIQGSCVNGRSPQAWLADYFGLSPLFDSTVIFKPSIKQAIFDINAYVGFSEDWFFRIHAPVVWTKWRMGTSEAIHTSPTNPAFNAGYMSSTTLTGLRTSFLSAMNGSYTFGDMKEALRYGIFCESPFEQTIFSCQKDKRGESIWGLSDVEAALGFNFLSCEDFHYGILVRASAPTGNRPNGICLFEPIVGNGKYWTLGGGITAHGVLWRDCECPNRTVSFYLDANISHLFATTQRRSFDLAGKPNSRYALIEEFTASAAGVVVNNAATTFAASLYSAPAAASITSATAPSKQYDGNLFYLINKSTFDVKTSYALQGDLALKFSYADENWEIDLGYNFWERSREEICFCASTFPSNTYALKGDAFIYGYTAANSVSLGANAGNAVKLSATQSGASAHNGTNNTINGGPCNTTTQTNAGVDAPQFALFGLNGAAPASTTDQLVLAPGAAAGVNQQQTSNAPVFISGLDFDIESNARALTHKLFMNISYAWFCNDLSPFIGIGAEFEFAPFIAGGCSNGPTTACCVTGPGCNVNSGAISQWGIWLKGGLAFE